MDLRDLDVRRHGLNEGEVLLYGLTIASTCVGSTGATLLSCILLGLCKWKKEETISLIKNSEEFAIMNEIYEDVMNSILKLDKEFNNNTVIDHYELMKFLYDYNYLSFDRKKRPYTGIIDYEYEIEKAVCLNGYGVCRHNANMLVDFFTRLDYDAMLLTGKLKHKINDEYINNIDQYIKLLEDNYLETYDYVLKELKDYFITIKNNEIKKEGKNKNIKHEITMVNDSEYSYYLDLVQGNVYHWHDDLLVSPNGNEFDINDRLTNKRNIDRGYTLLDILRDKDSDILANEIMDADTKYFENIDMFNKFNNEIKDELEEANEVYKGLKKSLY